MGMLRNNNGLLNNPCCNARVSRLVAVLVQEGPLDDEKMEAAFCGRWSPSTVGECLASAVLALVAYPLRSFPLGKAHDRALLFGFGGGPWLRLIADGEAASTVAQGTTRAGLECGNFPQWRAGIVV